MAPNRSHTSDLRDPYFPYSRHNAERYHPYDRPPQNLSDELEFVYPHAGEYLTDKPPPVGLLRCIRFCRRRDKQCRIFFASPLLTHPLHPYKRQVSTIRSPSVVLTGPFPADLSFPAPYSPGNMYPSFEDQMMKKYVNLDELVPASGHAVAEPNFNALPSSLQPGVTDALDRHPSIWATDLQVHPPLQTTRSSTGE